MAPGVKRGKASQRGCTGVALSTSATVCRFMDHGGALGADAACGHRRNSQPYTRTRSGVKPFRLAGSQDDQDDPVLSSEIETRSGHGNTIRIYRSGSHSQ